MTFLVVLETRTLNMKFPLVVLLTIVTSFFGTGQILFAQEYIPIFSQNYSSRLSIELDPTTFLLSGYSFHLRYQPMFSERLIIGGGTYGLDLPELFANLNNENRDKGWQARIRSAYAIYGEMYLTKANLGWFVGEQIGFQNFSVSNDREVSGATRFSNMLFMTYVGYSWHPYKGSFYIKPWAGLGITGKVDGISKIGDMKYDISPLFPFMSVHIGYSF